MSRAPIFIKSVSEDVATKHRYFCVIPYGFSVHCTFS